MGSPCEIIIISRLVFLADYDFNPSSPEGGCTNPPNGFRPGAQNRTAKG